MIGVIERIKNNVLLKCSTINDEAIEKTLNDILDKSIYQFAEELVSMLDNVNINITESAIRSEANELLKIPITKKVKRKLFIDSLAIQITNDSFIEDYANNDITHENLVKTYLKELEKNKKSNQLNMTEDLNLSEIIQKLLLYIDGEVISKIKENEFLVNAINSFVDRFRSELENSLEDMIKDLDLKYLDILTSELETELEEKQSEGEYEMLEETKNMSEDTLINKTENLSENNEFSKYDDMTLFNKMILSLNTKEEKLTRDENKLNQKKEDVENLLSETNRKIEVNIERENRLSQRKLELNNREKELNSRLSEAEVIFLNMKPLIKGLNNIKEGGNNNE